MQSDTIKLLQKCDQGAKMAFNTMQNVYDDIKDDEMRKALSEFMDRHLEYIENVEELLHALGQEEKRPSKFASKMAETVTDLRLKRDDSDPHIAAMMIEGADKGNEMLGKAQKKLSAATQTAQMQAQKLIGLETDMRVKMQSYL